ncbi:MAG: hypothetical protein J6U85_01950 [Bacteroidales bacterium]|nr:hypothetical protein [Bacteroidales bacterium]
MNTKETNNQNQSEEIVMMNKNINDKKENTVMKNNEQTLQKTSAKNEKAAYAAGGFAAGLASGVAGSAIAANPAEDDVTEEIAAEENVVVTETAQEVVEEQAYTTPEPEDVLLATDEGIRIAQVDDNASFSEAFADARAQVGPGGAFEWRGHVYNTYYAEEWNNMSAEERAEYQSKIDYATIAGDTSNNVVEETPYVEQNSMASNTEMVDNDTESDSVKVLGVEAVEDEYGNQMTIAAIEVEGEQALLVDVDNDGTMDALIVDENYDNQIDPNNEIFDIEDCNIETNDLMQMSMEQNEVYYASNDGMPDYMNDADVSSMA